MEPHHTLLTTAFLVSVGAYASGHLFRRSWKHAIFGLLAAPLVLVPLGVAAGSCAVALTKAFSLSVATVNAIGLGTAVFTIFGLFGIFVSHEFGERNRGTVRFAPKVLTRPRRWRKLPIRPHLAKSKGRPHHDTPHSPFPRRRLITDLTRLSIPGATQHQSRRLESFSRHARSIGR